jgi:hypothetical protein
MLPITQKPRRRAGAIKQGASSGPTGLHVRVTAEHCTAVSAREPGAILALVCDGLRPEGHPTEKPAFLPYRIVRGNGGVKKRRAVSEVGRVHNVTQNGGKAFLGLELAGGRVIEGATFAWEERKTGQQLCAVEGRVRGHSSSVDRGRGQAGLIKSEGKRVSQENPLVGRLGRKDVSWEWH